MYITNINKYRDNVTGPDTEQFLPRHNAHCVPAQTCLQINQATGPRQDQEHENQHRLLLCVVRLLKLVAKGSEAHLHVPPAFGIFMAMLASPQACFKRVALAPAEPLPPPKHSLGATLVCWGY